MPSNELRSDDEMLVVARRRAGEIRARRTRGRLAGAALAVVLAVATTAVVIGVRDRNADEQVFAIDPPVPTTVVEDLRPLGWSPMAASPLSGRAGSVTAWTGVEMIVWRGDGAFSDGCTVLEGGETRCGEQAKTDGARYDPSTDSWRMLPPAPVADDLGDQLNYAGVWTGEELVVWGGPEGEGAAYDPTTDSWRTIASSPLAPRRGFHAAWTGSAMIVQGGLAGELGTANGPGGGSELGDGAAYDPASDSWRMIASGPVGEQGAGVYCGGHLVVLDDVTDDQAPGSTAHRYDPEADTWSDLSSSPVEFVDAAACAGTQVVAVGTGTNRQGAAAARLDVGSGVWVPFDPPPTSGPIEPVLVSTAAPSSTPNGVNASVLLIGSPMAMDGAGDVLVASLDTRLGTWTTLPPSGLSARSDPAAVWADDELLVWGGAASTGFTTEPVNDGARYRSGSSGTPEEAPPSSDSSSGPAATTTTPADVPTEPEEGDVATWDIDPIRPPAPSSSTFTALVRRLGCSGGVTGTVLRPGIEITDTEVAITFTVEADPDGRTCPGNDQVPYEVDLGQPLGERVLIDGSCLAGRAATSSLCPESGGRRFP